ncbi:MAG: glycosyltransferase family 1 protein [Nitrospiraceae bacterium]|nr:MAG: glycosyltransferase family 1 protein [Nitrospiraceae bacterium]
MKKIKIAQVITRLDWGGSPDIIRLVCKSLDPDRFDITLITGPSKNPSSMTENFLTEFKNRVITVPQLQRDVKPLDDIIALFRLYRLFRKEKFDIVHTHTAKAGALGRIAARLAGRAGVIHTSHGHNFYGYFGPAKSKLVIMAERFLTHFTDRITALTDLEKKDLSSYNVARPEKVDIINSGLELELYRNVKADKNGRRDKLGIKSGSVLVGMVGRLEQIKGPGYFIEAAVSVAEKCPQAEFLVVGEGSLRYKLESRCRELKISDRVTFTGWREDIPEILPGLDILVLPSLNEAVGRTLIEAGACGIPVVATKVGGIPEIVKDMETGILVPPGDADGLARALISLIEDNDKRQRMGEMARFWADDKFSASRMVASFSDLYESVCR